MGLEFGRIQNLHGNMGYVCSTLHLSLLARSGVIKHRLNFIANLQSKSNKQRQQISSVQAFLLNEVMLWLGIASYGSSSCEEGGGPLHGLRK